MIRKDLLNKELEDYKHRRNIKLEPMKYNRDFIFNLFKKYKNYGMVENSYCCYGEECCCWQEVVEEGVWFLTLAQVKRNTLYTFEYLRHCLRSVSKFGNRMYIYKDKNNCYIYIYARDVYETDFHIWFSNE